MVELITSIIKLVMWMLLAASIVIIFICSAQYIKDGKEKSVRRELVTVKVKKLRPSAIEPHLGIGVAAGYDLSACIEEPITVWPGTTQMVGTGLSVEIPIGYFGAIFARSGLASKKGLRPANCVGVCDADYRGEYIVALHNDSKIPQTINPGDRIAQLVIMPTMAVDMVLSDKLSETERGEGGFGSTGE